MKYRIFAMFLWTLAILTPGQAAVVQYDAALPLENAFLSNSNIGTSGSTFGYTTTANRWVGLSFSPGIDTDLGQISLYVSSRSDALANKEISIQVVSLTSLTATPQLSVPSTILTTERGLLPSSGLANTEFAYLTLNLENPVSLEAGGFYGIIIYFVPQDGNNTVGFSMRNATSESSMQGGIGGSFYTDNGGTSYSSSNVSYVFSLAAPIPEPSTTALLGVLAAGAMGGYLIRRRRRNAMWVH